ncbi:MAG: polysaccharide biosynthesis C-terminal domain-containing protein [Bacteroides sp.]|nr:polysaccharide biosynthesis C-terminal domain-containing protein [Eubacterium sp.]MCM1419604.1 polysaccharide biosynthesis C-terminal domain-containing protein [Roseburia sp.]MCM1463571.1 polysaccharide biosynthesis C-terminal domain-containing protein [Bacteroides sp.]
MNRYKTLAANTIILGIGQFGSKFLVILMMGFYQAALGTTGYGEINNIIDTATLLMSVATLSIGESLIRFGLDKAYPNRDVFSIGLRVTGAGLVVCLLFVPLIGLFSNIFPDNAVFSLLKNYAWITILYVTTGSVKSCCALFVRSAGYVRLYALDGILTTVMNILFNLILLFWLKLGNIGYLLSVILADVCSIGFLWVMAGLNRYFTVFKVDREIVKAMLRFCLPMIPTSIMWWIINSSGSLFVSGMIGFEESGLYKAAYKLPSMISIFSGIFSQAWNMSAITEKNSATIASFYTNVFNIFQSVVYVIAGGLMLVIKPAIEIICEAEFHTAYHYTPFMILSVSFTCFSTFMGSVYVASKKSVRSMVTAAIGAGANLVLNALLILLMGLHGAALSGFISFLIIFVLRAADTRRMIRMDLKLPKMLTNAAILLLMSLVIFFVDDPIFYYVALILLFGLIVLLNYQCGIMAVKMILKKK